MVKTMVDKVNGATAWLRDKILPWMVITLLVMIFGMAGAIIRLQSQITDLQTSIEMTMLRTTNLLLQNQIENNREISRLDSCVIEQKTLIDILMKQMHNRNR